MQVTNKINQPLNAVNCTKIQVAINSFFDKFDSEVISNELLSVMMDSVIQNETIDRLSITQSQFVATELIKLVRAIEPHSQNNN